MCEFFKNSVIKRGHYMLSTLEDVSPKLAGSIIFSEFDTIDFKYNLLKKIGVY